MRAAGTWVRSNPILAGAIALGLIARIVFWAYTGRVADDALITVKHAKNLVDGYGLTHHLGEGGPVHGFTSVLSVLVPIPGELFGDKGGIAALRIVSLASFVVTALAANGICRRLDVGPWALGFALAYLALDQNQILYGMAGMETQIATAVLLVGVYYVLVEDFAKAGAALGLAVLARPDFVLWAGAGFVYLLFRNRRRGLQALLIGTAFVLPWVIFATGYYGSPVPNTIIAKAQQFAPTLPSLTAPGEIWDFAKYMVQNSKGFFLLQSPFFERAFVVSVPVSALLLRIVSWTVVGLAVIGAASGWRRRSLRPAIGFTILWLLYEAAFLGLGYFEWYGVPVMALMVIFAAIGLTWVGERLPRIATPAVAAVAGVLAFAYAMPIPYTFPIEARIQHQIEEPVRDQVGRYLASVIGEGQTWMTEPSGYFGYYTNATLLDYPGLTSKLVTDALADQPSFAENHVGTPLVAKVFEPDWLVLRPGEWQELQTLYPDLAPKYTLDREFKAEGVSLEEGGLEYFDSDSDFLVLRKTGS